MKVDISKIQREVLKYYDLGLNYCTCLAFNSDNKIKYQRLLEEYYTGKDKFDGDISFNKLYFNSLFEKSNEYDRKQITYYRLFMLEIFKDVVKNEKI